MRYTAVGDSPRERDPPSVLRRDMDRALDAETGPPGTRTDVGDGRARLRIIMLCYVMCE